MKCVLIVGLDAVAKKNLYQFDALNKHSYSFDVITSNKSSFRSIDLPKESSLNIKVYVATSIVKRAILLLKLLLTKKYNHSEIYPAGRMGIYYIIMIKLFRLKAVVIERGDISLVKDYPILTQFSLTASYKLADVVWYKEPYMLKLLSKITKSRLVFIPNAVPSIDNYDVQQKRSNDLLWANRIIKKRRSGWVVDIFRDLSKKYNNAVFAGNTQKFENTLPSKVKVLGFVDVSNYYSRTKFFLLPSEVVFGNYSLLEAMACGVVPIVTKSDAVELIVEDGVNGFVTEFNYESYKNAVEKALSLSCKEFDSMSRCAFATIKESYSIESYGNKINSLYKELNLK